MRLITLCTILSAAVAAVAAQEIIAVEEWLESIKLSRDLARNHKNKNNNYLKNGQHHRQRNANQRGRKTNKRSSLDDNIVMSSPSSLSSPPSSELVERIYRGFPSRSELEKRALYFNSFQADSMVNDPVTLKTVEETTTTTTKQLSSLKLDKTEEIKKGEERERKEICGHRTITTEKESWEEGPQEAARVVQKKKNVDEDSITIRSNSNTLPNTCLCGIRDN
ncbi:hypothetical protein BGZ49_003836, partial [Haplosporangium sp. Z 27]